MIKHDKARDLRPVRLDMWESFYWQASIPLNLPEVHSVIDFGSGRNLNKAILEHFDIDCFTVDVSPVYQPDLISPIVQGLQIPQADLVSCFQCLEHNSYEDVLQHIQTLMSYSKKYLYISLPYNGAYFSLKGSLRIPKVAKRFSFVFKLCGFGGRHIDEGKLDLKTDQYRHHRWELGRPKHKVADFIKNVDELGFKHTLTQHNTSYPNHLFILFEK